SDDSNEFNIINIAFESIITNFYPSITSFNLQRSQFFLLIYEITIDRSFIVLYNIAMIRSRKRLLKTVFFL
ncbi:MAG: hypothetical protein ACTSPU_16065, partial [Promethearchaeota archaeon]